MMEEKYVQRDVRNVRWLAAAAALTVIVIVGGMLAALHVNFAGGMGTAEEPWQISTAEELDAVRNYTGEEYEDTYFILTGHIDLTEYLENEPDGWEPISSNTISNRFYGNFDGNGYQVTGLWIDREDTDYVGLFGRNDGVIRNLGVIIYDGRIVNGKDVVGALVGENWGTIERCFSEGEVKGRSSVGGLMGINTGNIVESYAVGDVHLEGVGYSFAGGLVGDNSGNIENSYAAGSVQGYRDVGGLVGLNMGNIESSYAAGSVQGYRNVGGLVGSTWDEEIKNSFYDKDTSGLSSSNNIGLATDEMKDREHFICAGWDFEDTWYMHQDASYPLLQWQNPFQDGTGSQTNPYQISNAEELDAVRGYTGAGNKDTYFILTDNIDLTDFLSDQEYGWEPIGKNINNSFTGNLDGKWYKITGLWIDRETQNLVGLFGYSKGKIHHLALEIAENRTVNGMGYVGGLVGRNDGEIKGVYVSGNISGQNGFIGGLVGEHHGSIINSYATGSVDGQSTVGGLVGRNFYGSVTNSYAIGNVDGQSIVGGLVGDNDSGSITNSFYDIQTTAQSDTGKGIGLDTTAMQTKSTYPDTDWDFDTVWGLYEGDGYPYLQSFKNNILITPDENQTNPYDGKLPDSPLSFQVTGHYKDTQPLAGQLELNNPSEKAGRYAITQGSLGNGHYQISFRKDVHYTIKEATTNLTIEGDFQSLTKNSSLEAKIAITGGFQPSGKITYILDSLSGTLDVSNSTAVLNIASLASLSAGDHILEISYSGDENHATATFKQPLMIGKTAGAGTYAFPTVDSPVSYHPDLKLKKIPLENGTGNGSFHWKEEDRTPTADISAYKVVFTPNDADETDYSTDRDWDNDTQTIIREIEMIVTPARTAVTVAAKENSITYGEEITFTATVSGVSESEIPDGQVAFSLNGDSPGVRQLNNGTASITVSGLKAGTYSITAEYSGSVNYTKETGILTGFEVKRTSVDSVQFPAADPVTYHPERTLADIPLHGGDTIQGSFAWAAPQTVPTAATAQYAVVFTPKDLDNADYSELDGWDPAAKTLTGMVALQVNKADPQIRVPEGITGIYGDVLSHISLPEGWHWENGLQMLDSLETASHTAVYVPADTVNYNRLTRKIAVEVEKRPLTITAQNITIAFGEAVPSLTWNITSGELVPGDVLSVGTLKVEEGGGLGTRPIKEAETFFHACYEITFIEGTLTVLPNAAMQAVIDAVQSLPDPIETRLQADAVAAAERLYRKLKVEEQKEIAGIIDKPLEKARQESSTVNHSDGELKIEGVPWNIRIVMTKLDKEAEQWRKTSDLLNDMDLLALYHMQLTDTLDGTTYKPGGQTIKAVLSMKLDTKGRDSWLVHATDAGAVKKLLKVDATDSITFTLSDLGLYGITSAQVEETNEKPVETESEETDTDETESGETEPDETDSDETDSDDKSPKRSGGKKNKLKDNDSEKKTPKTGDYVQIELFLFLILISIGGVLYLHRRKS